MGNHWQLFSLTKISCSRPLDSLVDAAMSQLCTMGTSFTGPHNVDVGTASWDKYSFHLSRVFNNI